MLNISSTTTRFLSACLKVGTGLIALGACGTSTAGLAVSGPRAFAPINQPGPALSESAAALAGSLQCKGNVEHAGKEVALFVPGTALTPAEFSWNWFRALNALRYPYCSVTFPGNAVGDAQVSAEYVVYAIREVSRRSGRPIAVLGHSQGGTLTRFALRFWPDLRPLVADAISLAGVNHGSLLNDLNCAGSAGCIPALWQLRPNANFIRATNSFQETFPGISYTNIYTLVDQYVQPNQDDNGSTSLHGGGGRIVNVSLQSVCATDFSGEHIATGTYDPVAYALALDALTHDGPVDPARLNGATCARQFMPGVSVATFHTDVAGINAEIQSNFVGAKTVLSEPTLKPYVYAR